ncbi:chromosomal replication initiator protein DnaA [Pelotomaculum sp. PtaB.Bin117]|uniref:chromosomal replication initiator protein DnaA n=1 Tax=Pelotomaculum sp. PtaB.Bin117 TaxID=1811694 RepID=UPI002579F34F|nr:chromosomal replication initiator protein DnaA [Pelotomaculum sp. PtaB.Bin117]
MKSEVQDLWDQSLQILQKKINKYSFETLLKSLKPLGCHENTIIIEAPSYFTRDWLSDRYAPLIKEVFQNILNKDIDVKFLISSEISDIASSNKKQNDKNTDDLSSTHFNPKYSFKNFVIGNSNRFAHAACLAVAESPSKTYNPLFIYGGAGLGKTHLMQAIGWFILENHNRMKVSYVTSEKFTNELINSIRDYNTNDFRNKYRNMDILLVDDIQFLAGKESTQEEFFHTFNSLYEDNRQIIISSDRPPKEIPTLEDRLRSRFEWGLITDIQPPDLETRIAILRKKGQLENLQVPDDTISYIADKIQSNIRVLEGALIKVIAYASLYNEEITPELAAKVLKDILPPEKPTEITVELIQQVVSSYYNLRQEDFKAKRRTTAISFPRQIAMYLTKELTDLSLPKIGDFFGGRDHTTVLHACNKISNKLQEDYTLQNVIAELVKKIKNS